MSRHEILATRPGDTAFVGWDPPLMTFFGQVYRRGRLVKWVGADWFGELLEIEDLVLAMRGSAEIDHAMQQQLCGDKDEDR